MVTGASSGIGRAVAARLAGAGAGRTVVAAACRAADALVAEIGRAGGRAVAVPTDVTDSADLANLVDQAGAAGPIEALINVAGVGRVHSVLRRGRRRATAAGGQPARPDPGSCVWSCPAYANGVAARL